MKIKFTPTVPEEIEYTMTISMTIKDWIGLKTQLQLSELCTEHPACELAYKIRDLVHQADQWFLPKPEPVPHVCCHQEGSTVCEICGA